MWTRELKLLSPEEKAKQKSINRHRRKHKKYYNSIAHISRVDICPCSLHTNQILPSTIPDQLHEMQAEHWTQLSYGDHRRYTWFVYYNLLLIVKWNGPHACNAYDHHFNTFGYWALDCRAKDGCVSYRKSEKHRYGVTSLTFHRVVKVICKRYGMHQDHVEKSLTSLLDELLMMHILAYPGY